MKFPESESFDHQLAISCDDPRWETITVGDLISLAFYIVTKSM